MSRPTLTYFDFAGGRGEECRLALHLAGIDFEDNRIAGRDWAEYKGTTPFGVVPVLQLGDRRLGDSLAILTFVGGRHEMHPSDDWEAARHLSVMAAAEDLRHTIDPTLFEQDAAEKKRKREALAAGPIPAWAANVEKQIRGPFVGGDALNVADIKLFVVMNWIMRGGLDHVPTDIFDGYPKLRGLYDAVRAEARVQQWYERFPGALAD